MAEHILTRQLFGKGMLIIWIGPVECKTPAGSCFRMAAQGMQMKTERCLPTVLHRDRTGKMCIFHGMEECSSRMVYNSIEMGDIGNTMFTDDKRKGRF